MTAGAVLLPLLVGLPLLGALALLVLPGALAARVARRLGVLVGGTTLAVALAVAGAAATSPAPIQGTPGPGGKPGGMLLELNLAWIDALRLRFHLGVDGISLPLVLLTAALSFLCLVYTLGVLPAAARPRALVGLILLLETGMLGTFLALDLLLFFVFFETVLIPMWFLIAVWGDSAGPVGRVAAANRFILYTLLGSALMLLGFLGIYARTGTLDMVELAGRGGAGLAPAVQVAVFLAIGLGFAIKTPMWPLHTWLPDAHTAAPTVGSVLLAGVLLKMGTYGLVRIGLPITPYGARVLAPYLAVLAVAGIIYGSLACLAQRDLKRLVAYSSIGHMGFVLLGISTLTQVGVNGALFANVAHGLITGLLFFLAGAIKDRHHTADLPALGGGLYARAPRLAGLTAFAAVASLGLPGLAGFWGEMLAMLGAFRPAAGLSRSLFLVLMVLAGLGTVLTAAYLLGMIRQLAQGRPASRWEGALLGDATRHELLVWAPLAAAVVLLGLWPALLLDVTGMSVPGLLGALR